MKTKQILTNQYFSKRGHCTIRLFV